jgi:ATP adenylyltransferase
MDKLWAPWRSKYIYLRKSRRCIFCPGRGTDKKNHIIGRSKHCVVMLNIYPYNNGHVMVAPKRHVKTLELLSSAELLDMMNTVTTVKKALDRKLSPDGYNIGINIGRVGGAGFAGHVHVHVVPRWSGDSNFMPVVGSTKVISESLDAMAKLLSGLRF